jgi:hypothetical protein
MGIWEGIVALFKMLEKSLDLATYWLNPKERKRRRKLKYLEASKELQSKRDELFKKGAEEGFNREIDLQLALVEKELKDLDRIIKTLE